MRWEPKNVEFALVFFQRGSVSIRISKDESSEEEEQHGQPYQQFVPHQTQFLDNSSQFSQPKKKRNPSKHQRNRRRPFRQIVQTTTLSPAKH